MSSWNDSEFPSLRTSSSSDTIESDFDIFSDDFDNSYSDESQYDNHGDCSAPPHDDSISSAVKTVYEEYGVLSSDDAQFISYSGCSASPHGDSTDEAIEIIYGEYGVLSSDGPQYIRHSDCSTLPRGDSTNDSLQIIYEEDGVSYSDDSQSASECSTPLRARTPQVFLYPGGLDTPTTPFTTPQRTQRFKLSSSRVSTPCKNDHEARKKLGLSPPKFDEWTTGRSETCVRGLDLSAADADDHIGQFSSMRESAALVRSWLRTPAPEMSRRSPFSPSRNTSRTGSVSPNASPSASKRLYRYKPISRAGRRNVELFKGNEPVGASSVQDQRDI